MLIRPPSYRVKNLTIIEWGYDLGNVWWLLFTITVVWLYLYVSIATVLYIATTDVDLGCEYGVCGRFSTKIFLDYDQFDESNKWYSELSIYKTPVTLSSGIALNATLLRCFNMKIAIKLYDLKKISLNCKLIHGICIAIIGKWNWNKPCKSITCC